MEHKNIGGGFDEFLEDEGILESAEKVAIKRVVALQLQREMENKKIKKSELAIKMGTSRSSLDRLLDPNNESITIKTLKKAASALNKRLVIQLV